MTAPLTFAALGIDHRHIFGMSENMMKAGAKFAGWWSEGSPETLSGFQKRFGDVPRMETKDALLERSDIDLILIAAVPADRAALAIEAMEHGKDVMTDKPGCTTLEQLDAINAAVKNTNRIWSIDFSERFEVPCTTKADQLIKDGAIGQVIQTVGLGPHRLNLPTRPDWFVERDRYGGILCDIASHQIDQFLYFTNSTDAEITLAHVANYANPNQPGLQDFGEVALKSDTAHGYVRVDWYTPDALPTWGDGRLTILGTEGFIELRKYVDIGRSATTDHLFLANAKQHDYIDCSGEDLPYFQRLSNDIRDRTETAMSQAHCFKVMELALRAQEIAESRQ